MYRDAARDEVATKLQVLEALRPQMDPRDFADVVKSILKSSVLSMLGESEQESAALVESELPQNAVREVEHMLETFKTRNASNGFCQEEGVESGLPACYFKTRQASQMRQSSVFLFPEKTYLQKPVTSS